MFLCFAYIVIFTEPDKWLNQRIFGGNLIEDFQREPSSRRRQKPAISYSNMSHAGKNI